MVLRRIYRKLRSAPPTTDAPPVHRNVLEQWCADELARNPGVSWETLLQRSTAVRREGEEWLFDGHHHHAQDVRLRTRIERDAFARMSDDWRALGFPFQHLVPSLATAIGSSADRPASLAALTGIILNDGVRRPSTVIRRLRFGPGSPYETTFEPVRVPEQSVLSVAVARSLRGALTEVVERGTARRVAGAFRDPEGNPLTVGGKTGSGDNRHEEFTQGGRLLGSHAINRTAAFTFFVGDRYYGMITASVPGRDAEGYSFTSALPLEVLKRLAPEISASQIEDPRARLLAMNARPTPASQAALRNAGTEPAKEAAVPASEGAAPPTHEAAVPAREEVTRKNEPASPNKDQALPSSDDAVAAKDHAARTKEPQAPSQEHLSPPNDDAVPTKEQAVLAKERTVSAKERTAPTKVSPLPTSRGPSQRIGTTKTSPLPTGRRGSPTGQR